jgi:hypothetical protein
VEELLQKHRSFVLAAGVGAFVFLLALLIRGCAVYGRDLGLDRAGVQRKAGELTRTPVPDEKYLKDLDRVVEAADARVAALAAEVGRTAKGERLWEECIGDVLAVIGEDTPENRAEFLGRARRLPSAAFSLLLERVRVSFQQKAATAGVEIVPSELGFEQVQEANFARYLAGLAAAARIVDRAIALGVDRVESIAVSGAMQGMGGTPDAPFLQSQALRFKFRGDPAALAELVRSVNDRGPDGRGRRIVLDEVATLGRPEQVRAGEPGVVEFAVRVFLVNLEAKEQ